MAESVSCLVLENLSKDFGGLHAVNRINLSIPRGERHVLIGPNGAGKTTLFNLISGEIPPTGGRILLFGEDVTRLGPHQRAARGIARTFQITNLFPELTVFENLLLACEALERTKFVMHRPLFRYPRIAERAVRLLHDFELSTLRDQAAKNISYGDQRKVEVALSLAGRPRLLLLDEPMAGLSSSETHSMHLLLQKLDPAITVLLIEHDMDVALEFAEKITVLHQGKVLAQGVKEEIRGNPVVQEIYLGMDIG